MNPEKVFRIMATLFVSAMAALMFLTNGPYYWPPWVATAGLVVAWALIVRES